MPAQSDQGLDPRRPITSASSSNNAERNDDGTGFRPDVHDRSRACDRKRVGLAGERDERPAGRRDQPVRLGNPLLVLLRSHERVRRHGMHRPGRGRQRGLRDLSCSRERADRGPVSRHAPTTPASWRTIRSRRREGSRASTHVHDGERGSGTDLSGPDRWPRMGNGLPPQKHGGSLEMPTDEGGVVQASEDGSGLTYFAFAPVDPARKAAVASPTSSCCRPGARPGYGAPRTSLHARKKYKD